MNEFKSERSRTVILTGIGGFIGAHCLEYFLKNTDWQIIGIDSFRHKGTYLRINEVVDSISDWSKRVSIYNHDLSVPIDSQLQFLITHQKIDVIINMASDSAVERSLTYPHLCIKNNCDLIVNVLEMARIANPDIFIQISTDEVYGEAQVGTSHKEWDVILPSNPYAASKAAQEAIAISYWRTFGTPVVITNCMNIIGERQDPEKFLPKLIQKIDQGQEMPIYGDNEQSIGSRFYLHALNKASALVFIANHRPAKFPDSDRPDRYNISDNSDGAKEIDNLQMAKLIASIMGKELKYKLVPSESARRGYDKRYALDGSKLINLGWKPPIAFRESLERIVKWTLENKHWMV